VTNAYQVWLQTKHLSSTEYPQNKFKLDLAGSLFQMKHELRAGRPACGRSAEVEELTAAASSSPDAFSGHYFLRVEERLQCDVCKAAKTTLECAKFGRMFATQAQQGASASCATLQMFWRVQLRALSSESALKNWQADTIYYSCING
jgi:hypothetical protein